MPHRRGSVSVEAAGAFQAAKANMIAARSILITGAGGALGGLLVAAWRDRYRLRAATRYPRSDGSLDGIDVRYGELTDFAAVDQAMKDVDTVVHLGGRSLEDSWEEIVSSNITGTYNVFEAARRNGVRRVVYASSHHVGGFHRRDRITGEKDEVRPDSLYAVSKVAGEALGRLYADKHGLSVICQRIGVARPRPPHRRGLWTWLSERDFVHLSERCVEAPDIHFQVVYGVSRNTRKLWITTGADVIGYRPKDDAEDHLGDLDVDEPALEARFQGGSFCAAGFDGDPECID
jgi:uronate dehydrogenase